MSPQTLKRKMIHIEMFSFRFPNYVCMHLENSISDNAKMTNWIRWCYIEKSCFSAFTGTAEGAGSISWVSSSKTHIELTSDPHHIGRFSKNETQTMLNYLNLPGLIFTYKSSKHMQFSKHFQNNFTTILKGSHWGKRSCILLWTSPINRKTIYTHIIPTSGLHHDHIYPTCPHRTLI